MIAKIEVGVALRRPPTEDAMIGVLVDVDVYDHDFDSADARAKELACAIACTNPNVVMPVRATIIEVTF